MMPKLSHNLRTNYAPDGAVVLDIVRGRIFRLNPTGSRILQMIESGRAEEEITSMLVREFSANAMVAASDIGEFLANLKSHSLLES